ncbi:MAG: TetR/AcrR family transcriptional regulator [Acidimicrobiales bacterium]|nr:TetR/AcrR family transcriptional regulator [Acidimicrobiales bacterium]
MGTTEVDTRERIVAATSALFMQQGYSATGLKAIAKAGRATTGSLYHFFPGGKAELAAATLRHSGRGYEELVMSVIDGAPDVVTGLRACFAAAADLLRATDYVDACPIATVALEVASSDEPLRQVIDEVFRSWLDAAARRLAADGVPEERAQELAIVFVAALEGGFLLSRVARDASAMESVGRAVVAAVEDALAEARRGS